MTCTNVLYVVNKKLPANDYRINYPQFSSWADVWFGMPGRTETIAPDHFVRFNFMEGLRLSYFIEFVRLWRFLRRHQTQIDLVHYFSTNLILFGPLVAFLAGKPSLVTVTGFGRTYNSNTWQMRLLRPIYDLLFVVTLRIAQQILFQNHVEMQATAKRWPGSQKKMSYIGSAVSLPVYESPKSFMGNPLQVILIARLLPDKGIRDFLNVATALQYRRDIEFVLIGPASVGFEAILTEVESAASAGIIRYLGELDPEQTQKHLRAAHIFFFPSYGEGMARVMLEAGFAHLCPIAYSIPANQDLIVTGRGFLLEIGDWHAATDTIARLLANRQLIADNADTYQQFVTTHFTMESYANRMDQIITQIIGRPAVPPLAHSADDSRRHPGSN